jgi:hypothetical protein
MVVVVVKWGRAVEEEYMCFVSLYMDLCFQCREEKKRRNAVCSGVPYDLMRSSDRNHVPPTGTITCMLRVS